MDKRTGMEWDTHSRYTGIPITFPVWMEVGINGGRVTKSYMWIAIVKSERREINVVEE